eukprot:647519-Alexandrium_andersonii.AAC.1
MGSDTEARRHWQRLHKCSNATSKIDGDTVGERRAETETNEQMKAKRKSDGESRTGTAETETGS